MSSEKAVESQRARLGKGTPRVAAESFLVRRQLEALGIEQRHSCWSRPVTGRARSFPGPRDFRKLGSHPSQAVNGV